MDLVVSQEEEVRMQCSLSRSFSMRNTVQCPKCGCLDEPKAFRVCCPDCKTTTPPIDLSRYRDAGEAPAKRPMQSDKERSR